MNIHEANMMLQARRIEIDPIESGDAFDIGLTLGVFDLKHIGDEPTGSFDRNDIAGLRRTGRLVSTVAFGQSVHEVVLKTEDAANE